MTKNEFLDTLADSLAGNVPSSVISENINYYKDYIENSGLSETEVLRELGDPHLIARTIIDSFMASKGPMADYYTEQARNEYSNSQNNYDSGDYDYPDNSGKYKVKRFVLKWYEKFIGIITLIIIIAMLLFLGAVAVKIIVRIILPVLAVLFIIRFITDYFRRG